MQRLWPGLDPVPHSSSARQSDGRADEQQVTAIPVLVLGRALVEVASQAWWLLEIGYGHASRVERFQMLRYRSAVEAQLVNQDK